MKTFQSIFKSKFHRENRNKFRAKENMSQDRENRNKFRAKENVPRIPTTEPVARTCPHCLQEIITNPQKRIGLYQWLLFRCLFACFLSFCCFWIPLTKDEMNDTIHYCPSCHSEVGIYCYHENNETCMGQGRFQNPNNQYN